MDNQGIPLHLRHLSSETRHMVKAITFEIPQAENIVMAAQTEPIKQRKAELSIALKRKEMKRAKHVREYLLEFFTRVTTVPDQSLVERISRIVEKSEIEIIHWFKQQPMWDAFMSAFLKIKNIADDIESVVENRIKLEKMYIEKKNRDTSLQEMKQEIVDFCKTSKLRVNEVTAWFAVQENYREAKKNDLLSMSIPIFTRRAEFASKHHYGLPANFMKPLPASTGLHPFYPVLFPIELPITAPAPTPTLPNINQVRYMVSSYKAKCAEMRLAENQLELVGHSNVTKPTALRPSVIVPNPYYKRSETGRNESSAFKWFTNPKNQTTEIPDLMDLSGTFSR